LRGVFTNTQYEPMIVAYSPRDVAEVWFFLTRHRNTLEMH
jgi:hypothetical protein